jgi:aspartate/methionine/tyrosine aminotransferase
MAAIAVAFHLLLDAGDEAIFSTPSWFFYEPMLRAADAVPRKVKLRGEQFDLDLSAIEEAISPRTRLVIINTPHNPTGRIYSRDQLVALAGPAEPRLRADRTAYLPPLRMNPIAASASMGMTSSAQQRSTRGR